MKFFRFACIFLILFMLGSSVIPVNAQTYRFQVPEQAVVVSINTDGSINIDYTIKFLNDSSADPIDYVDIGLPNYDFEFKNVSAEVDGVKITDIQQYYNNEKPGFSLGLGSNAIPAGSTGTVHAYVTNVRTVIYPATETEAEPYASLVFSPNWFGSAYCYGSTNYQMTILLPAGVLDGEARYYPAENWPTSDPPFSKITEENRIFYTWESTLADSSTQYTFGTSFPSRYLAEGAVVQEAYVPPTSSGGNTTSVNFDNICPIVFCTGFAGIFGLVIYSATVGAKKRKMQYLPPKISIEGHGVKRGLTAIEAAVLMEQPMDKIFTMILFGLLKKNAAEVVTKDPLDLKASLPAPAFLYGYETDFLAAFAEKNTAPRRKLLQTMMVNLIKSVGEKMKGFSSKETLAFYEDIMKRAWTQVETAQTPEVKASVYEEVMDWTMLDKKYENKTQDVFSGPILVPTPSWWWRYDPTFARPVATTFSGGGTPPPISSSGGHTISMPTMPGSAFAASVVGSVSNFSSKVLGGLPGFTNGVTNITNPPPPPSTYRSSGGSSGGHSCACACACAGCACACAGGGR